MRVSSSGTKNVGTKVPLASRRSEEHTSELQSRLHLVCRLLLEKKKKNLHLQPCPLPTITPTALAPILPSSRHLPQFPPRSLPEALPPCHHSLQQCHPSYVITHH